MTFATRARLSMMMFLQYFVWGIWLPMLAQHLGPNDLKLSNYAIGWIFTVYGFGSILGPFVLGQLADRYFATERVMAAAHFVGGLLLILSAYLTTAWPIFITLLIYCNLYMPTMALSNSLAFRNLGEENQHLFPRIRFWGTVGWIAAGLFFAGYLEYDKLSFYQSLFDLVGAHGAFESFLSTWRASVVPLLKSIFAIPFVGEPSYRDCLRVSGLFSILYALYCLILPHTPPLPARETDPIDKRSAVLESLELMEYRSFAVLVIVSGLVGIMLAFYFACENYFLEAIGVNPAQTGAYMTIGQISEAVIMLLVPVAVSRFGIKTTMLIGAGAWAMRFGFSALGYPFWLMISTIALHGFAFGFFFVVAQMYVDRAASKDIKASAQSLLIFVVYGMGTVLGSVLTGPIRSYFTETVEGKAVENWHGIWMGPFLLTLFCMLVFGLLFKEEQFGKPGAGSGLEPEALPAHH
ncbi:MFS transporter [Aquisphaera insulae]|uniref:MFS transporter n=1 Tax=Aquisphaera insulae TaxID=2712864 RepID=UPI0013E9E15E|nr:MFS transporter [Aquisphaera insulae]